MLRTSRLVAQLSRQHFADTMGYSSAFGSQSEKPLADYAVATAGYSSAAHQITRRKGHGPRNQQYKRLMRHLVEGKRRDLGMSTGK